jgi:hypothetical protein
MSYDRYGEPANEPDPTPGDGVAAEPAAYPPQWTPLQRVNNYWYAHRLGVTPADDDAWNAIDRQRAREHRRLKAIIEGPLL